MRFSTDRILTTHAGSLPRPRELLELILARRAGRTYDERAYDERLRDAIRDVVGKQVEAGIDVVDDGEYSKIGFRAYADERLSGYEVTRVPAASTWGNTREGLAFPEFYVSQPAAGAMSETMVCNEPVRYRGLEPLRRDLANLSDAIDKAGAQEAFMPAISALDVGGAQQNEYFKTEEEFLMSVADAMRTEYQAIVDAGFLLQIDSPRLTNYYVKNPNITMSEFRRWAEKQVELINYSIRGIPPDRVRYHTCYGINMGPRVHDPEMADLIDIILKINAGAYSFESANPRHEHEWRLWEEVKLPDGKAIIPGVITHTSLLVEHPELVAERIVRFANLVGRENVIAGADCGFGTQATATPEVHPSIVWAKLRSLVAGAEIASKRLWGKNRVAVRKVAAQGDKR